MSDGIRARPETLSIVLVAERAAFPRRPVLRVCWGSPAGTEQADSSMAFSTADRKTSPEDLSDRRHHPAPLPRARILLPDLTLES